MCQQLNLQLPSQKLMLYVATVQERHTALPLLRRGRCCAQLSTTCVRNVTSGAIIRKHVSNVRTVVPGDIATRGVSGV